MVPLQLSAKIVGVLCETAINLIIILAGMILPMLTITVRGVSAVTMGQLPDELGIFVFQLLLLAVIPISNLIVWKCLEAREFTSPIKIGLVHGIGLAISATYTIVTAARFFSGSGSPASAMVAYGSLLAGLLLSNRLSKASYRRFVGLTSLSAISAMLFVLSILALSRPW